MFKAKDNFIVALVGARRSGKTYLLTRIIDSFYRSEYDEVYIFYPLIFTPRNQYQFLKPDPTHCLNFYSSEALQQIIDYQSEIIKTDKNHRCLLIFDDCISEEGFKENEASNLVNILATKGRHLNISAFITTQYTRSISTSLRSNLDGFILFGSYGEERENIIKIFSVIEKKKFSKLYIEETKNPHSYLCWNNINRQFLRFKWLE